MRLTHAIRPLIFLLALAFRLAPARADWLPVQLPFGDYIGGSITGISAPGPSDVWAVTHYTYYTDDTQTTIHYASDLFHSRNDGLLWDLPYFALPKNPDAFDNVQLFSVSFADVNNGWAFGVLQPEGPATDPPGAYVFLHTTDRGATWTSFTLPNTDGPVADPPGFALDATDATHATAVHAHRVFQTTDGISWAALPGAYPTLLGVQAASPDAVQAAGTVDGRAVAGPLTPNGLTPAVASEGAFAGIHFSDAAHGWLVGSRPAGSAPDVSDGQIFATSNGAAWAKQLRLPNAAFYGVAAPDAAHVWAVGSRGADAGQGLIYVSQNGGAAWAYEDAPPGRLLAVNFRDAFHGWAGGDAGLYRYVPSTPAAPGDVDRSGQVDRLDAAALLRLSAGLGNASPASIVTGDMAGADRALTLADALSTLRLALSGQTLAASPTDPARVVVVYNAATPDADGDGVGDSEQVARYYALRRGVPEGNIIAIRWSSPEGFANHAVTDGAGRANWADAFRAVVEPLQAKIAALGRGSIDDIVFTYGTPYYFSVADPTGNADSESLDTSVNDLWRLDAENWSAYQPYGAPLSDLGSRYGRSRFHASGRSMGQIAVDANGGVSQDPYYLVTRIDGPTVAGCEAMVDNALFAEKYRGAGGYDGIAYVDARPSHFGLPPYSLAALRAFLPSFYDYAAIDESIDRTIVTFNDRGLPWKDEVTDFEIGGAPDASGNGPRFRDGSSAATAPRAMFYAGWYNYAKYNDVWDWLPGSVANDYDSASAYAIRGRADNLVYFGAGALAHGATAIVGAIAEPYNYHPKPDALMEYLADGYTFAEAATLSNDTPRTSHALLLGDPLYRPFAAHTATAVPVPTLTVSSQPGANGTTLAVVSDIPVRLAAQYTTDGTAPTANSPTLVASPPFYALRHTFTLPVGSRCVLHVTDPTSRITDTVSAG